MVQARKHKWRVLALAWAATAFFAWPILRHRVVLAHWEWRTILGTIAGWLLAAFLSYRFYRAESRRCGSSRAVIVVILVFLLTCFVNQIHHFFIDEGSWIPSQTSLDWQERLQMGVIALSPGLAPHSYRFLPNGIVLWMQLCRINFAAARDIYRLIFGLLLFYAIYRYARLYTDYLGGILTLFLVAAVFPISFEAYAGQLTDPLSHLSFVLAFIFLETGDFEFLLSTLLIGCLAKETVLALSGYYVLFCRSDRRYTIKAVGICVASAVAYYGVRLLVLHGSMEYRQISGVPLTHVIDNLRSPGWPVATLALLGGYATFLVLGWRETPLALKRLALYLIPVLLISNLFFGWLHETRNYMPAVFVLAVIAARYISRRATSDVSSAAELVKP